MQGKVQALREEEDKKDERMDRRRNGQIDSLGTLILKVTQDTESLEKVSRENQSITDA